MSGCGTVEAFAADAVRAGQAGGDLCVYYAGSQSCDRLHTWSGVRDHYLLHVVEAGNGTFEARGSDRSIDAGGAFLARPGEPVRYQASLGDPWTYHWVGFGGDGATAALERIGLGDEVVFDFGDPHRLAPFIAAHRELRFELVRGASRVWAATGRLYLLLQAVSELLRGRTDDPPELRPPGLYVRAVHEFVQRNYSRRTSVEEIAAYVGVSRKYLSQVLRRETGTTPREILIDYRLRAARTLLLGTDCPVGDVAQSCGYRDQLLFSRQFRRAFGCCPTEYRAAHCGQRV